MKDIPTISVSELAAIVQQDSAYLIDVRTPVEFREIHASGAVNHPLDRLDPQRLIHSHNGHSDKPMYVICKSGNRAALACERLIAAGHENVINVEGGTDRWAAAGLPVQRGKKAISLERQVRILAGGIVFVFAVLAIFVTPYFAAVSAFIGAGLVYAGVSDTCGMALMLARMPWNQTAPEASICETGPPT